MATEAAAADTPPISFPGWEAEGRPLRRYGARMIDLTLFSVLFFVLLGFPLLLAPDEVLNWFAEPSRLATFLVFQPVAYAVAGAGTAFCIARWGSTPGKWIFGIRVLDGNGERLTLRQAFIREINLFWWGVGLGLMRITFFMMIRSFSEVENEHRSRWDEKAASTVLARTLEGRAYAGVVIGTIIVILLKVWDLFERFGP